MSQSNRPPETNLDDEEDFGALLEQHLPKAVPKTQGQILDATVVAVLDDVVLVTYGSKEETAIPLEEFTGPRGELNIRPGETIRVLMTGWDEDQEPRLSYKKARLVEASSMLAEAAQQQVPVRGTVSRVVNGGVIVDVSGVDAFMPASQVDIVRVPDLGSLVGQEIEALIVEFQPEKSRAVVSRRKLLSDRRDTARQEYLGTLSPGATVTGTVRQVLNFGAFLSLGANGAVDALLPRSELSYDRGVDPVAVLTTGQQLEVKVLEADPATGKVTVSRKRLHEDPWLKIEEYFPVGTTVTGKVASIQPFGAFVNLQEGITGLLHNKDLSWSAEKKSAQDLLHVDDSVTCQVLEIDKEHKRLALSLKHLSRDPWSDVESKYPVGSRHHGVVVSVRDFGGFVRLDENTQALLHISDLSWDKRHTNAAEVLNEGDELDVVVVDLDRDRRRIRVGRKQTSASPFDQFLQDHPVGSRATGKVTRLVPFGAFVELAPGLEGLIHISELDEHRVDSPERVVRVGEDVTVKVLDASKEKNRLSLSRRQAIREAEDENIKTYMKQQEPAKGSNSAFGAALAAAMNKNKKQ